MRPRVIFVLVRSHKPFVAQVAVKTEFPCILRLFFYLLDYITRRTLISGFQKKKKKVSWWQFSQTKILNFSFFITTCIHSLWESNVFWDLFVSQSFQLYPIIFRGGEGGPMWLLSLTNSLATTAGTNTRNATFKIVHSDLLNKTWNVHQQYNDVKNLNSHMEYHTVQCSKNHYYTYRHKRQLGWLFCNWLWISEKEQLSL